ncbi:MAG: hypothetical protein NTX86_00015, partial [Candidatus Dependentiae bacterium]|nr:hypothetical protein [Candidatus Dependentiae bacterium]
HFRKIFYVQLIPEYALLALLFLIAIIANTYLHQESPLTPFMLIVIGLLIFFEGIKKTMRMLLQLACLNHKTALIEMTSIVTYTSLVWIGYFLGYPIGLSLVFIPMLAVSALSSLALCVCAHDYYTTLPDNSNARELPDATMQWRILRSRWFNFLNQASHMFFSSNFLVPFFALSFGFNQAGIFKLMSSIVHCITVILQKSFGISSSILLSHLKETSVADKQSAFLFISNHLNQVLYGIIIFFVINYGTIMHINSIANTGPAWTLAYLFFIISFSENFFIAYEKFFIAHEKSDHLFIFNLIIISLLSIIIFHAALFSQLTLLITIIAVRIIAFMCIGAISFRQWQIKPAFGFQSKYLIGSLIISIAFFILAQ